MKPILCFWCHEPLKIGAEIYEVEDPPRRSFYFDHPSCYEAEKMFRDLYGDEREENGGSMPEMRDDD